jgi:hypothetical protein
MGTHRQPPRSGLGELHSIRPTKKMRAVVKRDADFLEFLTLHPDRDSGYTH